MTRPLYEMFNTVPRHYDLLNKIMTLGLDKKWRNKAARACLDSLSGRILDICCGTGDLAHTLSLIQNDKAKIFALDYSRLMLDIAVQKTELLKDKPSLIIGDASQLPFNDGCYDCVGISFAFRNLTYRNPKISDHLAEIFRIIKPGGRFVIVESSQPKSSLIRKLFHIYLRFYVVKVGALISGEKSAYNYLAESATRFFKPNEIKDMLIKAGFSRVDYHPLFFGVAGIHIATK
ncbi:MAG: ubiquinone/menaquinone biosynthesis methyltransferase [Dehalococcoidales bacterium]|nr:MAG: ubiquinone/menaquinone biosynthesis methyltransferase [Dehalococcoidales bacterium]